MINFNSIFIIITAYALLILIHVTLKNTHPFIKSLGSIALGISGIIIVSSLENFTGIKMPINNLSVGVSAILGMPGLGLMAILNTLYI